MAAGLQGKDLAMRLGISRPYLTQIEKGDRTPAHELLIRLATELNTTPEWLLNGKHPQKPDPVSAEESASALRIADLERQLAVANETINNLSKALAVGRSVALRLPTRSAASARSGGKEQTA